MTPSESPTGVRLQKLLARSGAAPSRRKAEELIKAGRVTVNGTVATLGTRATEQDVVKVDGKRLGEPAHHRYLLLNKPPGFLSAVSDPKQRATVLDLLPPKHRRGLFPVGRLDYQTEGLILLTNDGDFAQRVAHPRYGCHKTYEVKVRGVPSDEALDRLRGGIRLEGRQLAPAEIRPLRPANDPEQNTTWWEVRLQEGRSRQIREMFLRVGHPVRRLRRRAIGPLTDPHLPVGAWRELEPREVAALMGTKQRSRKKRPGGRGSRSRTRAPRRRGDGDGR